MIPYLPSQPNVSSTEPAARPHVDLHSQFEDLLSAVWGAEENWRFDDRLDLALKHRREAA